MSETHENLLAGLSTAVGRTFAAARRFAPLLALAGLSLRAAAGAATVTPADMQRVYDEVKTPYKYGVVLRPGAHELVDCPSIFRYEGKWFMVYVANRAKVGYQTFLATSPDLLHWTPLGVILPFAQSGWDAWQADGGISLVDPTWGGSAAPERHDGKYWISYIGGALHGYEPDPLSIGLAWTTTPDRAEPWHRLADNPILSTKQPDVRPFEAVTLYKSTIIHDQSRTLGAPFVMFYNGKRWLPSPAGKPAPSHESIGMAVSQDLVHWRRYGQEPVVDNAPGKPAISGDPQIVRMGDLWVMFYFGFRWRPHAFDTFAVSRDLVHWTRWDGPNLIEPSEPWDKTFAHKPWVLKYDGVVYHFYCAVGDQGRCIAVATSKDLHAGADGATAAKP
ncbi:MAG TPA: hypothetical protein VHE61_04070 [Opitutaceae bacterium]|nr:hypothetical protein [Opitutaceae bacterium]